MEEGPCYGSLTPSPPLDVGLDTLSALSTLLVFDLDTLTLDVLVLVVGQVLVVLATVPRRPHAAIKDKRRLRCL